MDPTTFAEMRPGAYDIHQRVRDMNRNGVLASMCFPTFAGFSAGTFQQAQDKDAGPRHAPGLQRLAHRRVVHRVPGPLHPAGPVPGVGHRSHGRRGPPGGGQGLPGGHHARAAPPAGPAQLPQRLLGPVPHRPVRRGDGDVPPHRPGLRGHQHPAGHAHRQPDHPRHPGLGPRRPGPAVGAGVPEVPGPEGGVVGGAASAGSPSTSTGATATTRTRSGCTTTSGAGCRARCSGSIRWRATSPTRRR